MKLVAMQKYRRQAEEDEIEWWWQWVFENISYLSKHEKSLNMRIVCSTISSLVWEIFCLPFINFGNVCRFIVCIVVGNESQTFCCNFRVHFSIFHSKDQQHYQESASARILNLKFETCLSSPEDEECNPFKHNSISHLINFTFESWTILIFTQNIIIISIIAFFFALHFAMLFKYFIILFVYAFAFSIQHTKNTKTLGKLRTLSVHEFPTKSVCKKKKATTMRIWEYLKRMKRAK